MDVIQDLSLIVDWCVVCKVRSVDYDPVSFFLRLKFGVVGVVREDLVYLCGLDERMRGVLKVSTPKKKKKISTQKIEKLILIAHRHASRERMSRSKQTT